MSKQWTKEKFIEVCTELHEGYYDYSLVEDFDLVTDKVTIICPFHGKFKQQVAYHKRGGGCVKCRYKKSKASMKDKREDIEFDLTTREGLINYATTWELMDNTKALKAKRHKEFFSRLKEETAFIGEGYGPCVYLFVLMGGHTEFPECSNSLCSNKTKVSKVKSNLGFTQYCSKKCALTSPEKRERMSTIWDAEKLKERNEKSKRYYQELARSLGYDNPESYTHSSHFPHIVEKRKDTMEMNWEGGHFLRDPKGREKFKRSLQEKYGEDVTSPMHIPGVLEKVCKNEDGEWRISSEETRKKAEQTMKENWGGHFMRNEKFKENMREKNMERHGREYPNQVHIPEESLAILNDADALTSLVQDRFLSDIAKGLGVHFSSVQRACAKLGVEVPKRMTSKAEYELIEMLNDMGFECVHGTRPVSSKFEIDILIPSLNIGVEFNGMYWHSEERRDSTYHHEKVITHQNEGIRIIMLWEDEWLDDKEAMKKWLRMEILKETQDADRVNEITREEAASFMTQDVNHFNESSMFIGGYKDGELKGVIEVEEREDGYLIVNYFSEVEMLSMACEMMDKTIRSIVSLDSHSSEWKDAGFEPIEIKDHNTYWMKRGQWVRYDAPIGGEKEIRIFDAGEIVYELRK